MTTSLTTTELLRGKAVAARKAGRLLQSATPEYRKRLLTQLGASLLSNQNKIIEANKKDCDEAATINLSKQLLSRLTLNESKLKILATGCQQLADQKDKIGSVLQCNEITQGVLARRIAVPIGVLLVIFESRPDCFPQLISLAIKSGNAIIMKGGKEATHSLECMMEVVKQVFQIVNDEFSKQSNTSLSLPRGDDLITLITGRAAISSLLELSDCIDLVIPRGSNQLVSHIQENTRIPVMGHSEGICHLYIDKECSSAAAEKILIDSKTTYPSACNAIETVLFHESLFPSNNDQGALENSIGGKLIVSLKQAKVEIFVGPNLRKFYSNFQPVADFRTEYGDLRISAEIVSSVAAAVDHIHRFGSSHTDVIVSSNAESCAYFQQSCDSACVFANASSRFSDGYRLGLGAEVGVSTSRIHARGPVGVDGLMIYKWIVQSDNIKEGHAVTDEAKGVWNYTHRELPITTMKHSLQID